jgi:hypothetical protein
MLNFIIPWWGRWAALLIALLAAMAFGAAKVYRIEETKRARETAAIKLEGERQNAKTAETVARQKEITQNVVASYDADINRINAFYDGKLRDANSRRRQLPAVPKTAAETSCRPADVISSERDTPAIEFKRQCTITTQMFVSLRAWNNEQEKQNGAYDKR